MKKLFLLFVFSCSTFIFSNVSYAEWIKIAENTSGAEYYVNFKEIRKSNGYVYYWQLTDYLKPTSSGKLSSKIYVQGDCNIFRYAYLSATFHKKSMGKGEYVEPITPKFKWTYPNPNSTTNLVLKTVCTH
ncbi:hypothetical protein OAQ13_00625 [Candidatus Pelagibacter sp.]|nr:hypothetical protein [Candidatus Pelagibacter sp.]